jgi:hypothetical protein
MSMRIAATSLAVVIALGAPSATRAQSTGASPRADEKSEPGSGSSSQMLPSELAAKERLEAAGYTNVHNVNSGAEALTAKATKDGKEFDIVIDSFGKIVAHPAQ